VEEVALVLVMVMVVVGDKWDFAKCEINNYYEMGKKKKRKTRKKLRAFFFIFYV